MKYKLNALDIDAVSNEVDAYLARWKTENKDRVKTKLAVEETLLNYMSAFGSEAEFTVDFGGGLSQSQIRLAVLGGMTASFTILFTQLSLPVSDLAVILSLSSILDFVSTAANVFTGQCMLVITSRGIEGTNPEVDI